MSWLDLSHVLARGRQSMLAQSESRPLAIRRQPPRTPTPLARDGKNDVWDMLMGSFWKGSRNFTVPMPSYRRAAPGSSFILPRLRLGWGLPEEAKAKENGPPRIQALKRLPLQTCVSRTW